MRPLPGPGVAIVIRVVVGADIPAFGRRAAPPGVGFQRVRVLTLLFVVGGEGKNAAQ